MRPRRVVLMLAVLLTFVAARHRAVAPPEREPIPDVFSLSNPTRVTSTHLDLDLTVDFNAQVVRGSVTHTILNRTGDTEFIVDTNFITVENITADGQPTPWKFFGSAPNGSALVITVGPKTNKVRIDYHAAGAGALHWLKAQETRSGAAPAVWSENEPDLARTWIPLQDTPSVRVTYDATIHTPANEMALMSATGNPTSMRSDGTYHFSMPHSIPPYLIALTVGKYEFRDLGNRTGVYAEPVLIDDTKYEMQFLGDMVKAAERILGPYPFERYDLVFPPKYTGGMENPELNFIGQDAVTGNHPDVVVPSGLVAHELAHSWFGDLMTCAEWNDLWLNEGFATYYATRIEEESGAPDVSGYALVADRQALDSFLALKLAPRLTMLHHATFVGSERPSFTVINYQKGEMFLKTLEDQMGRSAFDALITRYEQSHPFHWVDDVSFRDIIVSDPAYSDALLVDDWIYGSGAPSSLTPIPPSALLARTGAQADAFHAGTKAANLDTAGWTTLDFQLFLSKINDVLVPRMSELDAAFGFSKLPSPPLLWLDAAARSLDANSKTLLDRYLSIGKTDSLGVWQTLGQSTAGKAYASALFTKVQSVYDSTTRKQIAQSIGLASGLP
jgi:leukotriene-A4 hydrolase